MTRPRIFATIILIAALVLGYLVFAGERATTGFLADFKFKLGLDLSGGTHLVYRADISGVAPGETEVAMTGLRDVIERRVNLFGVSEPLVQVEKGRAQTGVGSEERLIVELPGVTDIEQAVALIGATPVLEFKLVKEIEGTTTPEFVATGLTGRFLKQAVLNFETGGISQPIVSLEFNDEGGKLFEEITTTHVGERLAIFLDGAPISVPVINEPITEGKAVISGQFTPEDAKLLVGRLNSGALPVPISLISTQKIGASLGADALAKSIQAGVWGLLLVGLFMILWYRLPGVVAAVALVVYVILNLALFKLLGVTLTAPGIAGFILSIGMAVDGNILIFERMKEELAGGKKLQDAIKDGFARAWAAIWDGNITAIVSAIVLFWFGTSLIEGFALTFGIGVILSMFSSITVSRTLLYAIAPADPKPGVKKLFNSGLSK